MMCLNQIFKRITAFLLALLVAGSVILSDFQTVEAAPVVAPAIEYTFYDVLYTIAISLGFELAPVTQADGSTKPLGEEMWDEVSDLFALWLLQNFGTDDREELAAEFRNVPYTISDGAISLSQDLWDALKSFFASVASDDVRVSGLSLAGVLPATEELPYRHCCTMLVDRTGTNPDVSFSTATIFDVGSYLFVACGYKEGKNVTAYIYLVSNQPFNCKTYVRYLFGSSTLFDGVWDAREGTLYNGYYYAPVYTCGSGDVASFTFNGVSLKTALSIEAYLDTLPAIPDVYFPDDSITVTDVGSDTKEDTVPAILPITDTGVISDVIDWPVDVPGEDVQEGDKEDEKEESVPVVVPIPGVVDGALSDSITVDPAAELTDTMINNMINGNYGNITKLFPFCIPFDFINMIKGMQAQQAPPVFSFKFRFKQINYTFKVDVDLSDYDKYIQIFRTGMKIFWIIGLMFLTVKISQLFI